MAIRSNHVIWLGPGEKVHRKRWGSNATKNIRHRSETRCIREIIFGKRRAIHYYQISNK